MRERVSAMGFVPRLLLFGLPTLLIVSQCSERPDYPSAAFRSAAGGSGGAPGHEAQMSEQASDPFSETRIEAEFDEAQAAGTTRALNTFIAHPAGNPLSSDERPVGNEGVGKIRFRGARDTKK